MHKNMTHFFNHSPRRILMSILKIWTKAIDCLTYNLYIIHCGMKMKSVRYKFFLSNSLCKFFNTFYGLHYML